ncbi:ABC transporter substrate-binding protein [Frankia sp. R43]|uniref:extracellular solute-binding protein n=1 Tax=Frankia sp. R43 TaxID=269536 RepID=UPI0006CA4680|nr:extracellular solute-binding protein [Frankia sp. R43]KPM50520.1 ABC transporter substrate-binding protein [Frankia sp. R43]
MRAVPLTAALAGVVTAGLLTACGGGSGTAVDPAESLRPTARAATASVDDVNGAKASAECAASVKTLRMYAVGSLNDAAKSGKAYMEAAHPGLTVELSADATGYPELVAQLSADRAAGRPADVAVAGFDLLPTFADELGAQPLSPKLLRASYDQRFLHLGEYDGKLVAIPQQVSMLALVYNVDALKKAGVDPATLKTTTGVLAAAEKIKNSGQSIQPIDLPTQGFGQWYLSTLASSKGTPVQKADGQPDLTTPAAREAAAFLRKVGTYGPQSGDATREGLLRFGIRRETAISAVTLPSISGGLKYIHDQGAAGFEVGVMPFPTLPGGTIRPVSGGNGLAILSTDRCQREMATELVVALLSPDVIKAGTEAFSFFPVDNTARTQLASFYQQYPELTQFDAFIPSLVQAPQWGGTRGGEVHDAINDEVVAIMTGADPNSTLAGAQRKVTELVR